MFRRGGGIIT